MKQLAVKIITASGVLAAAMLCAPDSASAQDMAMGQYEGTWEIQSNGDVKVTRKFTLPMIMYNMWKNNNMHMLEFRNFVDTRSAVEVTDKKYEWDDVNRTLILGMKVLGLANNMGDNWEAKMVPGLTFSNLDENKKRAYFHFSTQGLMGMVIGKDIVVLPPDADKIAWDQEAKALTYYTPSLKAPSGGPAALWWILAALFIVVGVAIWGVSLAAKPGPAQAQAV